MLGNVRIVDERGNRQPAVVAFPVDKARPLRRADASAGEPLLPEQLAARALLGGDPAWRSGATLEEIRLVADRLGRGVSATGVRRRDIGTLVAVAAAGAEHRKEQGKSPTRELSGPPSGWKRVRHDCKTKNKTEALSHVPSSTLFRHALVRIAPTIVHHPVQSTVSNVRSLPQ